MDFLPDAPEQSHTMEIGTSVDYVLDSMHIRKAFNFLDYGVLLEKECVACHETAGINWFKSCLSSYRFHVETENK